MKRSIISISLAFIFLYFAGQTQATTWYVDNAASGSNSGISWTNAWKSFSSISWGSIDPGDTVYISGGSASKTYKSKLVISGSGSTGNPIYIKPGQDAGHNGTVIISPSTGNGIFISGKSWVTINGDYGGSRHIRVTGCDADGIVVFGASHHIVISYLEVDSNGNAIGADGFDISLNSVSTSNYPQVEVSSCSVHDNDTDQFHITPQQYVATAYGRVVLHHNEIYNLSDDGVEAPIDGLDYYNNTMHTFVATGSPGHPDGVVFGHSYARVHDNIFYNLQLNNVPFGNHIYGGYLTSSGFTDICCQRIYNNLVCNNLTPWSGDFGNKAIEITLKNGVTSYEDVIIANNTCVGSPGLAISVNFSAATLSNVKFLNNIISDCGRIIAGSSAIAIASNDNSFTDGSYGESADVVLDYNVIHAGSGTGRINWKGVTYKTMDSFNTATGCQAHPSPLITDDDPRLDSLYKPTPLSTNIIDTGVNLSDFFTDDLDGFSRGSSWDIGAYNSGPASPTGLRIIP